MKTEQKTKTLLTIGLIVLIMGSTLAWTAKRDATLMEWGEKYEQCVAEEYHTTPSAYYQQTGAYPECDVTK